MTRGPGLLAFDLVCPSGDPAQQLSRLGNPAVVATNSLVEDFRWSRFLPALPAPAPLALISTLGKPGNRAAHLISTSVAPMVTGAVQSTRKMSNKVNIPCWSVSKSHSLFSISSSSSFDAIVYAAVSEQLALQISSVVRKESHITGQGLLHR